MSVFYLDQQQEKTDHYVNKPTVNKSRQNSTSSINSVNSSTNSLDQQTNVPKNRVVNLFSRIRKQDTSNKDQQLFKKCLRCKGNILKNVIFFEKLKLI